MSNTWAGVTGEPGVIDMTLSVRIVTCDQRCVACGYYETGCELISKQKYRRTEDDKG